MKGTCPKCGGPDGVAMLNDIGPCDKCYGTTAPETVVSSGPKRRRWVVLNEGDTIPEGMIAWNTWNGVPRVKDPPQGPWVFRNGDPHVVRFDGNLDMMHSKVWEQYKVCTWPRVLLVED